MNNTFLETIDADYYTLVVAAPLSYKEVNVENYQLGQDFLRGVAKIQTQVNLTLLDYHLGEEKVLPGQEFLERKTIANSGEPKGLRIVIFDDRNDKQHTQIVAEKIANQSEILGVIGHYASNMSTYAVDEYNKKNLSQVSFGTTTIELTNNPKRNFFRVVFTNKEEADAIVNLINQINIPNKRISIFYNPNSFYSDNLQEEVIKKINTQDVIKKVFDIGNQRFNSELALQEAYRLDTNIFIMLPDGQTSDALFKAMKVIEKDNGITEIVGGSPLMNSEVEKIETDSSLKLGTVAFWHYLNNLESEFTINNQKLWRQEKINPGTATAYDATLVLIEAIKQQKNPTREKTLEILGSSSFFVKGVTGDIEFDTSKEGEPKNGDRRNFKPTTVKLIDCGAKNKFVPVTSNLSCE